MATFICCDACGKKITDYERDKFYVPRRVLVSKDLQKANSIKDAETYDVCEDCRLQLIKASYDKFLQIRSSQDYKIGDEFQLPTGQSGKVIFIDNKGQLLVRLE